MRQLTALDALFLAAENDRTQGHVSALGLYDPVTASGRPLNAALLRELLTERMHLLAPFRWRLAGVPFGIDHPYWVDEGTFDADCHVREIGLPAPGDQRQLADQVAHLIGSHLDRARPLWEMYVIHGLHDGSVAVLTKMHHAAVDGVSGAEVMGMLLDDTATGRKLVSASAVLPERSPSGVEMLGRGLAGMLRQPIRALRAMPTTLPHLDEVPPIRHLTGVKLIARGSRLIKRLVPAAGAAAAPRGSHLVAPRTPFQTRVSAHRRVAFGSLPLDDVKNDQEHIRLHRQRRCPGGVRRRAALLARRAGSAPDRTPCWASSQCRYGPASRWGPSATRSRPWPSSCPPTWPTPGSDCVGSARR